MSGVRVPHCPPCRTCSKKPLSPYGSRDERLFCFHWISREITGVMSRGLNDACVGSMVDGMSWGMVDTCVVSMSCGCRFVSWPELVVACDVKRLVCFVSMFVQRGLAVFFRSAEVVPVMFRLRRAGGCPRGCWGRRSGGRSRSGGSPRSRAWCRAPYRDATPWGWRCGACH